MPKRKVASVRKTSKSEGIVSCPRDPGRSSVCGEILSGIITSSRVTAEDLHLTLKLTQSGSSQTDPRIFGAFVRGNVICTNVLAKILPVVAAEGGDRSDEGKDEEVMKQDTVLSFDVVAREMISLRGDVGHDLVGKYVETGHPNRGGRSSGGTPICSVNGDNHNKNDNFKSDKCAKVKDIPDNKERSRSSLIERVINETIRAESQTFVKKGVKGLPKLGRKVSSYNKGESVLQHCKDTGKGENNNRATCTQKEVSSDAYTLKVSKDDGIVKVFNNKSKRTKYQLARKDHPFVCPYCCRTFATKQHLDRHARTHTGGGGEHKCEICSRAFFDGKSLVSHRLVHSDDKPFKCTHCDKTYTMHNTLKKHISMHHAEVWPFKCDTCGKRSSTKQFHKEHATSHSDEKIFQCDVCGKQFKTRNNLVSHGLVHKGYEKFKCDRCDRSYRSSWYLEVHKKTHTGANLLQCQGCGDWFSDPAYFKHHQRKFCKSKLDVQCEVCGRSFPNNRHLVSHMGLHTGERPFECDICGKAFAKPTALSDHRKRHRSETEFRCGFCGKFWISRSELGKHEARHRIRKRHVRLPEEVKPGRGLLETMARRAETSELGQDSDNEAPVEGQIAEEIATFSDSRDGSGQDHHRMDIYIIDDVEGDQNNRHLVSYVDNGFGGDQRAQTVGTFVDRNSDVGQVATLPEDDHMEGLQIQSPQSPYSQ